MNLENFHSDDYQNRKGSYPKSGSPTNINALKNELEFSFKSTEEETALAWVKDWLNSKDLKAENILAYQEGDYKNDWVSVLAREIKAK